MKCLKSPLRSGLAGLALASQRVPVASEAAPREAGLAAQAFRGSAQAPSEPLVDGLSWHRGYPLRRADLGPLGKDRRVTFDDVGGHNVTTKTTLGARVRQQVGVPHGAQHKRILEGEKKRGVRGPATRSAFWGCRACKAARDEAAKQAREARRRNGERRDWDDWKHEDSAPPQASLAHILSGSCAGNKVAARGFMRAGA